MKEEWKDIDDYEGLYQISNLGKIKSTKRQGTNGGMKKPSYDKNNYLVVGLIKNGFKKTFKVHRLVAQAFIPNPNNYKEINHIDGNKENNVSSNIEWCNRKQNCIHRTKILKKGNVKKVGQYDINNNIIKVWSSITEASKKLKIDDSCICDCCRGNLKTAGGYVWRYV